MADTLRSFLVMHGTLVNGFIAGYAWENVGDPWRYLVCGAALGSWLLVIRCARRIR